MRPLRIGVNCDASSLFNTDPKDPNKYECEGQKAPLTSTQLCDWYLKLISEHPLLTFIEDPFSENDIEGYRAFQNHLRVKFPQVQISRKFKDL
jgi:enolase